MKSLLLLVLIIFFPTLQQVEREEPDLQVVKFNWVKEKQNSRVIRGAQNPGGPITTPIVDARDLGSRKADLRTVDKKATASAQKSVDTYELQIEFKNTGENVVRGVVWEFRPAAGPDDYQPKQYLCSLQVKPKEKKTLNLWTPYLPVKVISAGNSKDPLKDGTVVINQIEYSDGSLWKKRDWNYKLPSDSLKKLSEGNCSVF